MSLSQQRDDKLLVRQLPANIQAEQMLLGAILINCNLLGNVNESLRAEHFFETLHQRIYKAIEVLVDKGLKANPITLRSMLDKDPLFIEVGGPEYLAKLTTLAMVVINSSDYGKVIFDLARRRNLIQVGEEIVNVAYDSTLESNAEEQLEQAESKLYQLSNDGIIGKGPIAIKHSFAKNIENFNKARQNSNKVTGISTGLIDLDKKLAGFQNSDLVIIAGRPSMGKTAFALNLAYNTCINLVIAAKPDGPKPSVGFFSLEMSSEQLSARLLSKMAEINSYDLRSGTANEEKYNDLMKAQKAFAEMPFFIDDTPALTIAALRSRARKLKRKNNLSIIFVDYLQLLSGSRKYANRVEEISEITQGLKAIAKELNIPVIALAQLSRAVEQREDKRPMLSDLRESGSIEQDADVVMFIYREEYYLSRKVPKENDEKYSEWLEQSTKCNNIAEIIIAKHRNGAIGNIQLHYDDRYSTITNLQRMNADSVQLPYEDEYSSQRMN